MNTDERVRDDENSPSKEQVLAARRAAGLSQKDAAKLVNLGSCARWSEYERGTRNIDPTRFELFQIKTGQHAEYGPLTRATCARK